VTADPTAPLDELVVATNGTLAVPDTWQQGRGAFGGLVIGAMCRALEDSAPDRPLRSLTAELCGPLQPGDASVERSVLRAGNAVTTSTVGISQHGEVQAHGVGVLGRTRATDLDRLALAAPTMPAWSDVPVAPILPPAGPAFAQHFEYRVVTALPFSGAPHSDELLGWVRPKRPGTRRDAAFVAACVDAYWPLFFVSMRAPRPMATIAYTLQVLARLDGLDPDAPLAYRARLAIVSDGYFVEFRELWGHDGRLLALNQQTFAVIK
jgi:hypothetical protein